jgi:GNAT superfamily N-acetyltransferase
MTHAATNFSLPSVAIVSAHAGHLGEIHAWRRAECEEDGEGLYRNWQFIANALSTGRGVCAVAEGRVVGFAVFERFEEEGDVDVIQVHPDFWRRGIGTQLLRAAREKLEQLGARLIEVECVTQAGYALCKHFVFEDYVDPKNYRSEYDDPMLRLYLSEWRPREASLYA